MFLTLKNELNLTFSGSTNYIFSVGFKPFEPLRILKHIKVQLNKIHQQYCEGIFIFSCCRSSENPGIL